MQSPLFSDRNFLIVVSFQGRIWSFLACINTICCLNPYWEQDDSRWALYLQGNSDNTIFQTSTFLGDLISEQTVPVTVRVGEILKSLKNFALEIFVFEETYSFLHASLVQDCFLDSSSLLFCKWIQCLYAICIFRKSISLITANSELSWESQTLNVFKNDVVLLTGKS